MKKKVLIPLTAVVLLLAVVLVYLGYEKKHTFTLSENTAAEAAQIMDEQIQPVSGTVKVSGDCDTSVEFTDIKTGKKYLVGYITPGITEKIKLEKNNWYTVKAKGNITLTPVNVRVE